MKQFLTMIVAMLLLLSACDNSKESDRTSSSDNFFLKIEKEQEYSKTPLTEDYALYHNGEKYFVVMEEVTQTYKKIIEEPPADLISYRYYLLNAKTKQEIEPYNNMYILTKSGLVKTDAVNKLTINTNRQMYKGSLYYIFTDYDDLKLTTDCKVPQVYFDLNKGNEEYDTMYIARFDSKNQRFIIDSAGSYLESELKADLEKNNLYDPDGKPKSWQYENKYAIKHRKKFDCS